ncbi:MAG: mechanosensitive ion channel family protein [Desulfurococcaceae archaeon]
MISFIDFNLFARIIASIIAIIVAYYIGKIAESQVKKARIEAPPEIIYNIARSLKMIAIIIGILVALSILEIDLTGLLIAAGFAGIVVGLAAQQTLSQLFAGIALIIEGRLKIGDSVKVGDDWGIVTSVGLLSTKIRLWSGEVLTIPNSNVMSSKIYNYSKSIARRADITIGISYNADISKAINIIKRVLDEKELVLAVPPPTVIVDNLGDSAVVLKILFWLPSKEYWTIRREIIREIKEALEKEGIEIPYPQRVLWVKSPVRIESTGS